MAINLISREDRFQKKMARWARLSGVISTLVLFAYIIVVGVLGWWWVTVQKKGNAQSSQEKQLVLSLQKLSEVEVVYRQVDERAKVVAATLDKRTLVAPVFELLVKQVGSNLQINKWTYGVEGIQTVTVISESVSDIETFVTKIKMNHSVVRVVSLIKSPIGNDWTAEVSMSDQK
jgi:hypothetical protein